MDLVTFQIENSKNFGLPGFEVGCVVGAGLFEVWLLGFIEEGEVVEYVAGLTFVEIVGTCRCFDPSLFRTELASSCKEYLKQTI